MRKIAIISPKGGAGKTVISVNLAMALTQLNQRVFLMDLDLKISGVASQLGIFSIPVSLNEVLLGKANIFGAIYIHSSGLRVIPTSLSLSEYKLDRFDEVLSMFNGEGFLIVDTPPTLSKEYLELYNLFDELILVITPELPSIVASLKLLKEIESSKVRGIVVNRWKKSDKIKPYYLEEVFGIKVIGIIPESKIVRKSLEKRVPAVYYKPSSKFSRSIKRLASHLAGIPYKEGFKEKIRGWLGI